MLKRSQTRPVSLGNLRLGGQEKVLIQSMASIKTSKVDEVSEQIKRCKELGCDLMRLSCLDMDDARSFGKIKEKVRIPLVADIHFDYRLALASIASGADAIRINPGNIGDISRIKQVVASCKERHIPIRVGVNSGSLDKTISQGEAKVLAKHLVESAKKHVAILESLDFHDIVISLKGSSPLETIEAYREAALLFPYPLHLGVTEAGPKDIGLIRSSATLSPLLLDGIGDTIRISLSDDPEEEVKACHRLLHDLGIERNYPTFISCPTCGRTAVNLIPLAKELQRYVESKRINKTIAVMGCIVNGPGEARHADLGAAGGNGRWVIFKKGEILREVSDADILLEMKKEIDAL